MTDQETKGPVWEWDEDDDGSCVVSRPEATGQWFRATSSEAGIYAAGLLNDYHDRLATATALLEEIVANGHEVIDAFKRGEAVENCPVCMARAFLHPQEPTEGE